MKWREEGARRRVISWGEEEDEDDDDDDGGGDAGNVEKGWRQFVASCMACMATGSSDCRTKH